MCAAWCTGSAKRWKRSPRRWKLSLEDDYETALRLYQGLEGTLEERGDALAEADLTRVLNAYPDDQVLAFVQGDAALQTEGSLADHLQQTLRKQDEQLCSIGVIYGKWGYDETFTPDEAESVWSADGLGSRLGAYVTPARTCCWRWTAKIAPG